jgi:hypothetical protein
MQTNLVGIYRFRNEVGTKKMLAENPDYTASSMC